MKKILSAVLICGLCFSPSVTAEDAAVSSPADIKLQKVTAEVNRNKELLEIWKDHVRTLTKERDEAYQQIEALKSSTPPPAPIEALGSGTVARFGQIETQPLPANAAVALPPPAIVLTPAPAGQDVQGYQDTIRELRRQLEDVRSSDQRMKKEIMEAGNDKTLIIKDKEQAIAKVEGLTKQINSLKGENRRLNDLLNSADMNASAAPQIASNPSEQSSSASLQNAFNAQSARLKQSEQEKADIALNAAALQKKYADLQSAYGKLVAGKPAAAPSGTGASSQVQNPYEVNHLKSLNGKLQAELQQIRAESAKAGAEKRAAEDDLKRLKSEFSARLAERDMTESRSATAEIDGLSQKVAALQSENGSLRDQIGRYARLQEESTALKSQAEAANASVESLRQQNESYKVRTGELESRLQNLKTGQSRFADTSLERENLLKKISQVESQNAALKNDLDKFSSMKTEYNALAAKAARVIELQADKDRLSAELKQEKLKTSEAVDAYQIKETALKIESENKALKVQMAADAKRFEYAKEELKRALEASQVQAASIRDENIRLSQNAGGLSAAENDMEKKYLQSIYSDLSYKMKRREIALEQALKKIAAMKAEMAKTQAGRQQGQSYSAALQSENEANKERLRLFESQKAAVQNQITSLRAELAAASEQNRRLAAEKDRILSDQQRSSGAATQTQAERDADWARIRQLQSEKESMQKQINDLRSGLQTAMDLTRRVKAEKEKMTLDQQLSQSSSAALKAENDADKSRLRLFESQKETVQNQISSLRAELAAANELNRKMAAERGQVTAEQQQNQWSMTVLKSENEANKARLQLLENQRDKAVADQQQYGASLAALRSENEAAQSRIRQLESDKQSESAGRQQSQSALETLKSESQADKDKIRLFENQKEKVIQEVASLRSDLAAANEQNRRLAAEKDRVAAEQQQNQSYLASLKSENEMNRTKTSLLESEKQANKNQIAELHTDLVAANDLNQKMKAKYASLAGQVDSLRASVQAGAVEKEKLASLRLENDQLAADRQRFREEADRRVQTLNTRISSLEAQKERDAAIRIEREKLSTENQAMKKAMVDLERSAQSSEEKTTALRSELGELRNENTMLRRIQQDQLKTIDDLKANLQKSLDDIQNLKSNFQAYLESLVSSFEERQSKKGISPTK